MLLKLDATCDVYYDTEKNKYIAIAKISPDDEYGVRSVMAIKANGKISLTWIVKE